MTRTLTPQNATWDDLSALRHDPVSAFARVLIPDHGRAPAPCEPEYASWKTLADYARAEAAAYRAADWSKPAGLRQYVADSLLQQWWMEWKGGLPDCGHWSRTLWRDAVDVLFDGLNAQAAARKTERLTIRSIEQARAA